VISTATAGKLLRPAPAGASSLRICLSGPLKGTPVGADLDLMSIEPAPSGRIAVAARRFGDDYPPLRGQWQIRVAGAILVAVTAVYLPWMFASLNRGAPLLAWKISVPPEIV